MEKWKKNPSLIKTIRVTKSGFWSKKIIGPNATLPRGFFVYLISDNDNMKMKILDYQDPCYGVLIVYNKRPVVNMDFEYF